MFITGLLKNEFLNTDYILEVATDSVFNVGGKGGLKTL